MHSDRPCPHCGGSQFFFLRGPVVSCSKCSAVLQADEHPPGLVRLPTAVVIALAKLEREHEGIARVGARSVAEQRAIDNKTAAEVWTVEVGRDSQVRFVDAEGVVSTERPVRS